MKADTPLPEVAHYLGADTAARLMNEPPYVQQACLETVRMAVLDLEERGTMLDPFHLAAFLDGIVRGRLEVLGRF